MPTTYKCYVCQQPAIHNVPQLAAHFCDNHLPALGATWMDCVARSAMQELIERLGVSAAKVIPAQAYDFARAMMEEKKRREKLPPSTPPTPYSNTY